VIGSTAAHTSIAISMNIDMAGALLTINRIWPRASADRFTTM